MYPNIRGKASRSHDKSVRVGTHLDTLRFACAMVQPTHVIEHGMGIASTPFIHNVPGVTHILSFENERQWQTCSACPQPLVQHDITMYASGKLLVTAMHFPVNQTIVLIDGDGNERLDVVNSSLQLGFTWVIEHDAECFVADDVAARRRLCAEHGYSAYQNVSSNPETALYVKTLVRPAELTTSYVEL